MTTIEPQNKMEKSTRRELLWLGAWCLAFFLIGGLVSAIGETQDYYRWLKVGEQADLAKLDLLRRDAFISGGAISILWGALAYGAVFLVRQILWRFNHSKSV